jgi:hypothetical protein
MAHFAEVNNSGIVLRVLVVPDLEEHRGQDFLANDLSLGGVWIQTSFNTSGGVHYDSKTGEPSDDQSKSFRKNFAGIGLIYDSNLDGFITRKEIESWVLNEETCQYEAPTPYPKDGKDYRWDEPTLSWVEITGE